MPRTGRPKAELVLSADERVRLERWARKGKTAQVLALRSRIVLGCAVPGAVSKDVAAVLGCSETTVGKWGRRFVRERLDGLVDEDRPGRPSSVSLDQVEDVIVATLESKPAGGTHWSQSSMAKRTGLSWPRSCRRRCRMRRGASHCSFVERGAHSLGAYGASAAGSTPRMLLQDPPRRRE
jgi:transposase